MRDVKPGNIYLRLQLPPGQPFEPTQHRDPARVAVLSAVVIDFGFARSFTTEGGRPDQVVCGTPGYLAPEQARGSAVLDEKTDVFGLAATVYSAMTGHAFFEDANDVIVRLKAHMNIEPLGNSKSRRRLPGPLFELLHKATTLDPVARPGITQFAEQFARL